MKHTRMKALVSFWRWLRSPGQSRTVKQEIDEELRFHMEQRTAENVVAGMTPEDAAREARKRFGNVQSVREECRDIRGASFGEATWHDVRFAFRQLRKNPGFTAVAVLTLAVCIGANLSIFAVVDAILVRSLPFPDAERLLVLHNAYPASGVERGLATITDYFERRRNIEAFESLSMFREETFIVGEGESAWRVQGAEITPEFFQTLGIPLALGQTFTDEELDYSRDKVVIITNQFWRDYFDADRNVIGRTFMIDSLPNLVIGVLPAGFRYLSTKAQMYRPLSHFRETRQSVSRYAPGTSTPDGRDPVHRYTARARLHDGLMVARLGAGRSVAQAQAELNVVNSRRLAQDPLGETLKAAGYHPWIESLRAAHVNSVKPVLLLVQVGALFLLLLGTINLAGLLLIRASGRAKEMAVRLTLGAGRAQLARGVLVETTTLSLIGGVLGVVLACVGIRLALSLGADALPLGADIVFNLRTAVGATLVSIAIGAAIGLPVLWLNPRGATSTQLTSESRAATTSRSIQRVRHGLIVTQIAVACVLLYGAGVLGVSLKRTLEKSPGFEPDQVLSGDLMLPWRNYEENPKRVAFVFRMLEQIRALPGVSHAAVSSALPFTSRASAPRGILPEGFVPTLNDSLRAHYVSTVTGDYWRAMQIPLLKGRFIEDADCRADVPQVAVIDEALAHMYWPEGDAIGRRFCTDVSVFNPDFTYTVVGIVGSVKQQELAETSKLGAVYLPYTELPNFQVIVRTSASASVMGSTLQQIVKRLDPGLPLTDFKSMRARIDDSLVTRRSPTLLAAMFAGVALLLAGLGTYGVLAYAVAQRRSEVAVRMACGATPRLIGRQFLTLGAKLLVLGVALGSFGAWTAGRAMRSVLVEVPSFHVSTGVATVLLMSLVALLAGLLPARRATQIDPMEALRHE
jgi:predicted permease